MNVKLGFLSTVSAICYTVIICKCPQEDFPLIFTHNQVVNFILLQHKKMPDFLRLPIAILTISINGYTFLKTGKLFTHLPPLKRKQYIEEWKNSWFGVSRDLIRFYESLTIFAWYSSLE